MAMGVILEGPSESDESIPRPPMRAEKVNAQRGTSKGKTTKRHIRPSTCMHACAYTMHTFQPVSRQVEDPQVLQPAQAPRDGTGKFVKLQMYHLHTG